MVHIAQVDEETALLAEHREGASRTPLPWRQLSIVLTMHMCEPMSSQIITPFLPQLIRDVGITGGDERKVGHYVGLMQSLFFVTEAMTVLHWSRLSDRIGRKPVLIIGLCGLAVSMCLFGLSRTFWTLVLSRCLTGMLNGNVGILRSLIAEITDTTNVAQAFSFLPLIWSIGCTVAPNIGGSLARPAERFPPTFDGIFWKEHPYFLPCAISACYVIFSLTIAIVFLRETAVPTTTLLETLRIRKRRINIAPHAMQEASIDPVEMPVPFSGLMTRTVLTPAINYAAIAFLDISLRSIQPLFFSTSLDNGGLGLLPHQIGLIMSVGGLINGFALVAIFPVLDRWLGTKFLLYISVFTMLPAFALLPVINLVARSQIAPGLVQAIVGLQVFLTISTNFAISCASIFVTAASPNRASLGATNGIAQVAVSIARAIGPAFASSLFSLSLEHNLMEGKLVYIVMGTLVVVALSAVNLLPRQLWKEVRK